LPRGQFLTALVAFNGGVEAGRLPVIACAALAVAYQHRPAVYRSFSIRLVSFMIASTTPVGRKFETGTAPYELLAGFSATIAYLESLCGMQVLKTYERELGQRFLDTLRDDVTMAAHVVGCKGLRHASYEWARRYRRVRAMSVHSS